MPPINLPAGNLPAGLDVTRTDAIFDPWFRSRMLAEIRNIFDEHRVCWAPYRTIREIGEPDLGRDST